MSFFHVHKWSKWKSEPGTIWETVNGMRSGKTWKENIQTRKCTKCEERQVKRITQVH